VAIGLQAPAQCDAARTEGFLPLFILSAILCAVPCVAQNASVSGMVSDSSGAVIQRAKVVLTNSNTNAVYQAATDDAGVYRVSGVVPGISSATVSKIP
jgi:hypothetical protein